MSIRLMTMIWDSGCYSGGTLLVALALADFANDDGSRIFPHVETLAKKARLSVRATQLALETLKEDGILIPLANTAGGRGKSVEYRMDVERVKNLRPEEKGAIRNDKGCKPEQERVQENAERVQSATPHIEEPSEPSMNRQDEPPAASPPGGGGDLFGQSVPQPLSPAQVLDLAYAAYAAAAERAGWSAVQKRTAARDKHLKARLADVGGLEGWKAALEKAQASEFLCGKVPPTPPRTEPMLADFDFLTNETKFTRLMEGKYDNRAGGAQNGGGGFLAAAARRASAHPY